MKSKIFYPILCFCCLQPLLFSCEKQTATTALFQQVETLMPIHPDSAQSLLKQMKDIHSLSKKNQAHYYLLLTEADDKTYTTHTTDSLIHIAATYYDDRDNSLLKAKAWYYMGRVNQELKNPLKAQEYYLKALEAGKNSTDPALLGRIYNNIGMLYTYQEVYEKAIPYQQKAIEAFELIADSTGQAYALRDLARNYTMLEKSDSAIACYEQAMQFMSKVKISSVYSELGDLYIKEGNYPKANQYIQLALQQKVKGQTKHRVYLIFGELQLHLAKLDSAETYLKESYKSPNLATRAGAIYYLAEIANRRENWRLAVALNKKYETLCDSLDQQKQTESIRKTAELYNYHQAEEQLSLSLLHIANLRVKYLLVFIIGSILLMFVVYAGILLRKKKKLIQEQRINLEKLRNKQAENEGRIAQNVALIQSLEKLLKKNSDDKELICSQMKSLEVEKEEHIANNNVYIQSLEEQLNKSSNDNESIRSQMKSLKTENNNLKSQQLTAIERFKMSEIYVRFHDKEKTKVKKIEPEEWTKLFQSIDLTYPQFAHRLNERLPESTMLELQVCNLIKANVPPSLIATLLNCSTTNISMTRKRLYQKAHNREGSSSEFDQFIRDL